MYACIHMVIYVYIHISIVICVYVYTYVLYITIYIGFYMYAVYSAFKIWKFLQYIISIVKWNILAWLRTEEEITHAKYIVIDYEADCWVYLVIRAIYYLFFLWHFPLSWTMILCTSCIGLKTPCGENLCRIHL